MFICTINNAKITAIAGCWLVEQGCNNVIGSFVSNGVTTKISRLHCTDMNHTSSKVEEDTAHSLCSRDVLSTTWTLHRKINKQNQERSCSWQCWTIQHSAEPCAMQLAVIVLDHTALGWILHHSQVLVLPNCTHSRAINYTIVLWTMLLITLIAESFQVESVIWSNRVPIMAGL